MLHSIPQADLVSIALVCTVLIKSALVSIVLVSMRMNTVPNTACMLSVQQSSCHVNVCQQQFGY